MATRKNRPVLYEVVRLSRRQRESSWKRRLAPVPGAAGESEVPVGQEPVGAEEQVEERPRAVRISEGRLYVDLGWPGMAVVGVALLFVLFIAFQAGGRFYRPQPAREPAPGLLGLGHEPAGAAAPDKEIAPEHRQAAQPVVTPNLPRAEGPSGEPERPAAKPAEPPASSTKLQAGYHYVVIQYFRKTEKEAAVKAAKFLRGKGVDCVIFEGVDLQLVATEPFLIMQKDANAGAAEKRRCDDLKKRIRELGKEYKEQGGGYTFKDCEERLRAK